jgi:hypothetical protein
MYQVLPLKSTVVTGFTAPWTVINGPESDIELIETIVSPPEYELLLGKEVALNERLFEMPG